MTLITLAILLFSTVFSNSEISFQGGDVPEVILTYSLPGFYDVYLGETGSILIKVNNEGFVALHNISIEVSGIPVDSYSIEPENLDVLDTDESYFFNMYIYTQKITAKSYTVTMRFSSDETSEISSFTLNVKSGPREEEDTESANPMINSIIILLIVVIVASVLILVVMLVLFKAKRCPLCGGKLIKDFQGKNYVSFKCSKCKYYKYKIKKTT